MVQDFLDRFKSVWTPTKILSSDISGILPPVQEQSVTDNENIAQALASHLNAILDFKDRMDSFDFLSNQARSNFTDISYTTASEQMINAISQIGGKDGIVDFQLAMTAADLVIEWIELQAADAVSASYMGKI